MSNRWWGKPSEFPWEQAALEHIRRYFPDREPYRAWAGFTFTARNERIRECDLFAVTPTGAYLVEIKSHPGRATNQGSEWTFTNGHRKTISNPLHLTDLKAKELRSRLEWAVKKLGLRNVQVPFIDAGVFLSDEGLRCDFDEIQQTRVYGREELTRQTRLPGIWSGFLGSSHQRVDPDFLRSVSRLMATIGVMPMDRSLSLGEYTLEKRSFDSGPTWTDYKARHKHLGSSTRVRLYHYNDGLGEDERRSVESAAKREYMSLEGISHEGIVKAEYFGVIEENGKDLGPAIAFRHRSSWQRLDHFMAEHGEGLDVDTRMEMVRQLAEAVNHAHRNRLYHRSLAARSVWVEMDGSYPRLYIADWQVAARESLRLRRNGATTHTTSSGAATQHLEAALGGRALAAHVEKAAEAYLAPEFPDYTGRAAAQDVFGLGALTYLIFTGRPPARDRSELGQQIQQNGCLTPAAIDDDIVPQLDTLVRESTQRSPNDRLATVQAFLRMLDQVEEYLTLPEVTTDPLEARRGDQVVQEWKVREVLGKGATSRALLMADDRADREIVYKVALNEDSAAKALRSEAVTLRTVGAHPRIVALASTGQETTPGIQEIGDRTVLLLERAGESTLADHLAREGALATGELLRFGRNLLDAVEHLEEREVFHRDIKPANLGVRKTLKQGLTLVLFDFSLSQAPLANTSAGTRGYLDPFLGQDRPYDEFAERYALAATMHEMATGELPVWDDEGVDPEFLGEDVETPRLSEDAFPKQHAAALTRFFQRALHRRIDRRFGSLAEMRAAWEACFHQGADAEPVEEDEETRRRNLESATLETPIHMAGLTPLAVDTAQRVLGCETVGDLLSKPVREITHLRGVSLATRNELRKATTEWRKRLNVAEYAVATRAKLPSGADEDTKRNALLDQVIRQFLPATTAANKDWVRVVRSLVGLPEGEQGRLNHWPTHREVARELGITPVLVDQSLKKACDYWIKSSSLLGSVRDDVVEILARNNRVREVGQIATELLNLRGSTLDSEERLVYALATVRVVVECEERRDDQRFVVRRYPRRVIAAQVIDGDPRVPVEDDLLDYAELLGRRADELVSLGDAEFLPGPGAVREALRGVEAPEGMDPFSDTALVQIAAAASERAEATPRLELYPADLDLKRALRITQAIGYLGRPGVTPEQIRDRVKARFPALPEPGRDELRAVLRSEHSKLREEPVGDTVCWYLEPELTTYQPSTHTGHNLDTEHTDGVFRQTWRRLEQAVGSGGYRALKTWLPDTERVAEALRYMPGVVPFDVSAEFIAVVDEVMDGMGARLTWDILAEADNSRPEPFNRMLDEVFRRLGDRVRGASAEAPDGNGVVLLHRATPLARYEAGRSLLGSLVQQAREADRAPYGLWLLCPMRGPQDPARLDGRPAGIIADAEQVLLPRGFSAPESLSAL